MTHTADSANCSSGFPPTIGTNMKLTALNAQEFGIDIDLVYASDRNFTKRQIYRHAHCYLHEDAVVLLRQAVALAAPLGLRLKIFDAFRPAEAQWRLWTACPDQTYVADPRRGSPHSMGVAVDLTLVDASSGTELEMGTEFDDLSQRSWHGDTHVPLAAQRNRLILLGLMTAAGFDFFRNEWWHYQMFNPRGRYPVLSDSVLPQRMMGA